MFELSYQEHKGEKDNYNNSGVKYGLKEWRIECQAAYQILKSSPHWHNGIPCRYVKECRYYKGDASE